MKKLLLLLSLVSHFFILPAQNNCIDSSQMCSSCVCPQYVYPVCGCNGVTYINSCYAINAGVLFWTDGACGVSGCVAGFIYTPDSTGLGVTFNSASSGNFDSLHWNFGDGDSVTTGTLSFHHTYSANGLYNVCLTISGDSGCSNTTCQTVAIAPAGPCPDTSIVQSGYNCGSSNSPVCGCNGITYNNACEAFYHYGVTSFTPGQCPSTSHCQPSFNYFTDSSGYTVYFQYSQISNGIAQSFSLNLQWAFGDGGSDTGQYPVHTYTDTSIHSYVVCVTATDTSQPCTSTYCDTIFVGRNSLLCNAAFNYTINNSGVATVYPDNNAGGPSTANGWIIAGDTSHATNPNIQLDSNSNYNICYYVSNDSISCTDTVCINVHEIYAAYQAILGNNDVSNPLQKVYLFPNPASNTAELRFNSIQSGMVDVIIRNLLGEVVYQLPSAIPAQNSNALVLNLTNLCSGVYLVELRLNNISKVACKLVKM